VQPIANTIVGDIYSPVERARVQGLLSGVFGVAAIIGPSLGAFIVQFGDWPLVFWINLPVGAAAITMIALLLPEQTQTRSHSIDYAGSLLLIAVVTAVMLLVMEGSRLGVRTMTGIAAVIVLTATALLLHERRSIEPMLPLDLWRNRIIVSSSVGSLITGTLMMGVIAYLPAYIQGEMGRGPEATAIILPLQMVVWVLGSTAAGLYLPRSSYRVVATLGALMLTAGAAMLIAMTPACGAVWAAAGAMLVGAGMGFCNTTFMISAQTSVTWQRRGAATSASMFLRFLGQSLGAALFAAVINASLLASSPENVGVLDRLMDGHGRALLGTGALTHLVTVAADAMRHAYLLTGALALCTLAVALTYPARLGPATQARQR
jgi:MFS family permease